MVNDGTSTGCIHLTSRQGCEKDQEKLQCIKSILVFSVPKKLYLLDIWIHRTSFLSFSFSFSFLPFFFLPSFFSLSFIFSFLFLHTEKLTQFKLFCLQSYRKYVSTELIQFSDNSQCLEKNFRLF